MNSIHLAKSITPMDRVFAEKLASIAPFSSGLHPLKRWQLLEVERVGRLVCSYFDQTPAEERPDLFLVASRTRLTYFADALTDFDVRFATTFRGRTRAKLDASSEAAIQLPLVEQYERDSRI